MWYWLLEKICGIERILNKLYGFEIFFIKFYVKE